MKIISINASIIDQAVISGSNFAISIFLAKVLSPAEYGLYILAFTTIVLALGLTGNCINIPLNLIGVNCNSVKWREVVGSFLLLLVCLCIIISSSSVLTYIFLKESTYNENARIFLALGAILPFLVSYEFLRSVQLIKFKINNVLFMDTINYSLRFAIIFFIVYFGVRDAIIIVYSLGFSCIIGIALSMHLILNQSNFKKLRINKLIIKEAWKRGKWSLADWFPFVIYGQMYIYIVAFLLGNHDNGILGVAKNFTAPVIVILVGITSCFLPYLRKLFLENENDKIISYLKKIFLFLGCFILLYLGLVCFFANSLLRIFSLEQIKYNNIVYFFAAAAFIHFLYKPADLYLLSRSKTKLIFFSRLFAAIPTLILCYPLINAYKLDGAVYINFVSHCLLLVAFYFSVYITSKKENKEAMAKKAFQINVQEH